MVGSSKVRMSFEHDLSAAVRGRRAVWKLLNRDATASFVHDAMLATSELVTNAVLHTGGAIELCAHFDQARRWLRVEVSDSSDDPPRLRAGCPPDQVGGLGLRVVEAVASSWGSLLTDHGKTVWFELVESGDRSPTDTPA